jgi:hypothetical protein
MLYVRFPLSLRNVEDLREKVRLIWQAKVEQWSEWSNFHGTVRLNLVEASRVYL